MSRARAVPVTFTTLLFSPGCGLATSGVLVRRIVPIDSDYNEGSQLRIAGRQSGSLSPPGGSISRKGQVSHFGVLRQ
jgi:hypothetical protein